MNVVVLSQKKLLLVAVELLRDSEETISSAIEKFENSVITYPIINITAGMQRPATIDRRLASMIRNTSRQVEDWNYKGSSRNKSYNIGLIIDDKFHTLL